MKLADKKYLIFDFDETMDALSMDWTDWFAGILHIIQKYDPSVEIPLKDIHFKSENIYIQQFGEPLNQDFIQFQKKFEKEHYLGHQPNQAIIQFMQKNLDQSKYVWSNNTSATITPILKELGLSKQVKKLITRDMVSLAKPDLDGFRKFEIPVEGLPQTLMIGDASPDWEAANAAGIDYLDVKDFVRLIKE